LFQKAIEELPAAVYMTDSEGRLTFYNEAAAELWGCSPELGESKFCGSWKLYWPDGTPLPHDECPMALALHQRRQIRGMEAVAERPDGTRIPFIPYPTPLFDASGRLTGAVNLLVDISEREQAQRDKQRLAAIVDSSDDAIVSRDLNGIVTSWNPGAERLYGYSAEEMIGKPIALLIPPHLQQEEPEILAQIAGGERMDHFETTRVRKDGQLVRISLSVSPIRNQHGRVIGASKIARDITERKKTERALTERNLQLGLAGKFALVGTYTYDVRTERYEVSPGYPAVHGLPEGTEETTRAEWRARVHPSDLSAVEAGFEQAMTERRREYHCEYRFFRPDGEVRWIDSRNFIFYGNDGSAPRLVGANIDITQHKATEAALKEHSASLADALAAGRVVAFEWDAVRRQSRRSDNAASIFGDDEDGSAGPLRNDFLRRVHPDDREVFRSKIRDLSPGNPSYVLNFRFCCRDGRQVWLEETAKGEFDGTGRLLRITGLTRDVTERREAELALDDRIVQLALAGKAVLVGTYAYDADTEIMQISDGYAAIHGLPEGTIEIARSTCLRDVHPDDIGWVEQARREAFRACRREYNVEYRVIRADGDVRWVETRCSITYHSEARPNRVLGVSIDITQRKLAEEQQGKLVAELDHRVKNVLATVQAVASHTMQTSSSMEHFVAALDGRIRSMGSTHELLSHRRWLGIPLAELVERELAPYTTGSNTEFDGPEVMLRAEAAQTMATVLHELATNAAKYGALSMPSGRVSITWRLPLNGSASDRLVLTWEETGGPLVVPPSKSNYGMHVVRELIPYELGGTVDHVLAPEGARCRMEIPLAQLRGRSPQTNSAAGFDAGLLSHWAGSGRKALRQADDSGQDLE